MKRDGSGLWPRDPDVPTDDRLYLVRRQPSRWLPPAVAFVLALPSDARDTAEGWERLLDTMDRVARVVGDPKLDG